MSRVDHYCEIWNLSKPVALATTPTSEVFLTERGDERLVLKVLTPIGVSDEGTGAVALSHFSGRGAVELRDYDRGAQLLEYVDGGDLLPLVRTDDARATEIIGDTLNALHGARTPAPPGLPSLHDRFASLRERAAGDATDSIYVSAARVAENLLASPREVRVLHGDVHHENILRHAKRGWLAIDPKGIVGEITYDAANALLNPVSLPAVVLEPGRLMRHAEILARVMQLDLRRLIGFTFAHACLSACWSLEDGQDPRLALAVARLVESISD